MCIWGGRDAIAAGGKGGSLEAMGVGIQYDAAASPPPHRFPSSSPPPTILLPTGPVIPWRPGRSDKPSGAACPPDGRLPNASLGAPHVRDVFGRMVRRE